MEFEPRREISREAFMKTIYAFFFDEEAYLRSKGLPVNHDNDVVRIEIELPPDHGYNEKFIDSQYLRVWNIFQEIDFDVDRFFMERVYDRIDTFDDGLGALIARYICCFYIYPMSSFKEDLLSGEIDIFYNRDERQPDGVIILRDYFDPFDIDAYTQKDTNDNLINDSEFLQRLYFCRTDEELWDLMIESNVNHMEIRQMCRILMGTAQPSEPGIIFDTKPDKERAQRMMKYFLQKGILL